MSLKKLIPIKVKYKIKYLLKRAKQLNYGKSEKILYVLKNYFKVKVISGDNASEEIMSQAKIKIVKNDNFVVSLDNNILNLNPKIISNITIDYGQVLNYSINDIKDRYKNSNDSYSVREYKFISTVELYVNKIIKNLKNNDKLIIDNLKQILNSNDLNFHQALQKILIFNTIAWQIGMKLNGFGRLDKILDSYYEENEFNDKLLFDFLSIINSNYNFKSGELLGDTGQIIILGGLDENGRYFSNKLTYKFIKSLKKLNKPDPKILLRVSSKMDIKLLTAAVECIKTGIGSPLLSNDDVIIPILKNFGCDMDSYNYITSACWEPLIAGMSMDQNNICGLNYLEPLDKILNTNNVSLNNLEELYIKELKKYIKDKVNLVNSYNFPYNPLLSMFTSDCDKKHKDVSEGGAKYSNFGFTTAGLANLTNSYFNLKKYCQEKNIYTFDELNEKRKNNYPDSSVLKLLKNNEKKFGLDDKEVINFVNKIINITGEELSKYRNKFGGKFKFGLSSPDYINFSRNLAASFDGRKNKEPLNVHISSNYSFDETISFACKLNYNGLAFNGNVIDFIITPDYIENNKEKFVQYIYKSIEDGFFQMQMNVVSSKILIDAKKNPEQYPNLIVRVWGFSAYFNDLPEDYKNVLIERALKNEQ